MEPWQVCQNRLLILISVSLELSSSLINNTSLMCHTTFIVGLFKLLLGFNEVLAYKDAGAQQECRDIIVSCSTRKIKDL